MTQAGLVHLDEIFLSLQGEAGEVGRPHAFLRLAGCPLRCNYCDTPRSWQRHAGFERHLGGVTTRGVNPLDLDGLDRELAALCSHYEIAPERITLAVTGGEPLEQSEFLLAWLPRWPGRVLLETAGIYPERLETLLPWLDFVSLDWKLRSTLREGMDLAQPRACLERAVQAQHARTWIKLVLSRDCEADEVTQALSAIAEVAPGLTVYLQPVTRVPRGPEPPHADQLLAWALRHDRLGLELRVLPQVHAFLGVR